MSLKLSDLHELYSSVTKEEAISMANLGAVCWSSFKDGLYSQWASTMTCEEAEKAAVYKEEGRKEGERRMLDSFKARLASVETLQSELTVANASLEQLHQSMDVEAVKRAKALLATQRSEFELEKMKEIAALKEQISEAALAKQMVAMLTETNRDLKTQQETARVQQETIIAVLQDKIVTLEATNKELQPETAKASHIIGKEGEDEVESLIQTYVLPNFLLSDLLRQTGKGHAGDFHLSLQSPQGKRMRILVEAKKYAYSVDKSEITKFKRDCDNPDNHLDAGILLSLQTSISCYYQFQIEKTETGRHIMYLSMQDLPTEDRGRTLLWAVRVLSAIVSYADDPDKQKGLLEKVMEFWKKMEISRSKCEDIIKACKKSLEVAESMRDEFVVSLDDFRSVLGIESAIVSEPVIKKRAAPRKKRGVDGAKE
jgi:hypothetical protein